jgi:hypothetical protein
MSDLYRLAELWAQEEAATLYLAHLETLPPRTLLHPAASVGFSVELMREVMTLHREQVRNRLIIARIGRGPT